MATRILIVFNGNREDCYVNNNKITYDQYQGLQKIGCFRNHSEGIELPSEKDIENAPVYYDDIDLPDQFAEEVNKNDYSGLMVPLNPAIGTTPIPVAGTTQSGNGYH